MMLLGNLIRMGLAMDGCSAVGGKVDEEQAMEAAVDEGSAGARRVVQHRAVRVHEERRAVLLQLGRHLRVPQLGSTFVNGRVFLNHREAAPVRVHGVVPRGEQSWVYALPVRRVQARDPLQVG